MEDAVFPPSPNWFLPNVISTREDGSLAYGSKSNLVLLKTLEEGYVKILSIHNAHQKKITGVVFVPSNCDSSLQNTVATCGEDGLVKLWKIDTLASPSCHDYHLNDSGTLGKVISMDWSVANPNYIVSAAENDTLVMWNVFANNTVRFSFQKVKLGVTVIACCPHNEKMVAVGGKTGQIFIINLTRTGEIVYKLRGHDNKIQSLSWCPVPYNVFEVNNICEEFLLASACQNKEVFIWRAGSNGKCEIKFQCPTHPVHKKDQYHGKLQNISSYTALFWGEPYKLYMTSNFCELLWFNISQYLVNAAADGGITPGQKINRQFLNCIELGHCFHSKGLFAVSGVPVRGVVVLYGDSEVKSELKFKIGSDNNIIKKDKCENDLKWEIVTPKSSSLLWTAGQDRKLLGCKMNSSQLELVFNYHTLNGPMYCAPVSPHDPNKVALGVGDGMIRLWNVTQASGTAQIFQNNIQGRVHSLAWHPTKDGVLAYGTSEGRIGVIDTNSNKPPSVFKPGYPEPVFTLTWGPQFPLEDSKRRSMEEFDLYCTVNDRVLIYNPSNLNASPVNLGRVIQFPCMKLTDVCWKPDYSLLAVGFTNGSICLIDPKEFKIVSTVFAYKKLIQSLSWHPQSTSLDSGLSPYHGYFTSGSTDNSFDIRVFNCIKTGNLIKVEKVATLKGHYGHVQSVSWSPHISCRLLSTSVDRSVQIWDVLSQAPLVNFSLITVPLFSMWSPIDSDVVLTGNRNDSLLVWRVSEQSETTPKPRPKNPPQTIKSRKSQFTAKKQTHESEKKQESEKERVADDDSSQIRSNGVDATEAPKENEIGDGKWRMGNEEGTVFAEEKAVSKFKESKMFSKGWKGDANEELKICYSFLKGEKNGDNVDANYSLAFLCDENSFKELIKVEEESLKKANRWTEVYELSLWNGNLKELLEEKIKRGDLNDFLVSLAPAVSPRIWQEACASYAKSLAEKNLFRKAATYLMVGHKIYEAIRLLADANLYMEALCIARSRLPISDPVITEVVREYAEWLFKNGALLKACQCYIYLEDYLEVTQICRKNVKAEYLRLAALAAKKCGSSELESLEAANCLLKCLEGHNFDLARQVCDDHEDLTYLRLMYNMYHTIIQLNGEELVLEKGILCHVRELTGMGNVIFPDSFQNLYQKYAFYKKLRQVYVIVAQELCFAACAEDTEEIITHLIKCLSTCNRYIHTGENEVHPLYKLCSWLCPEGFSSGENYFRLSDSRLAAKSKSLRAFLCAAIVRNLNDNQKPSEVLQYIDIITELKDDLLDKDSYKYFKNSIEVEVCETRIITNRNKLTRRKLTNEQEKSSGHRTAAEDINTINGMDSPNNETEKEETSSKSPGGDEREEEDLINDRGKSIDRDCNDCQSLEDLEVKITQDLDLLNGLRGEIERFETTRISCPNPVAVYSMLKMLCEEVPESESAKVLLEELERKWQELN